MRLQVEIATASWIAVVRRPARASTRAARPSGSASFSRSGERRGLVRGAERQQLAGHSSLLGELVLELALDARELRADDRHVDEDQRDEDDVGAGHVLARLVERQRGHRASSVSAPPLALGASGAAA